MAKSRTPNRVDRAKIVTLKRGAGFRRASDNIAAIDFGTKNCSLAYVIGRETAGLDGGGLNKLRLNGTHTRVPTAILLNKDKRVVKFGQDAKDRYSVLEVRERENVYYFDGIKVNLQRDKNVNRTVPVRSLNGKDLLLVEVIAQILGYLKRELLDNNLRRAGYNFSAEDFDWVVTVPAIWLASGKQMMREAAKMAGLCSDQNPDRLSLALEPESGAIYCHEMRRRGQVAYPTPHSNPTATPSSYSYLIVDIGGGTVDVSAHRVSTTPTLSVEELHHPDGNDWGGLQVNLKFSEFLQKMVGDRKFARYLHVDDADTKIFNRFELDELLNDTFEKIKLGFCRCRRDEREDAFVKLPDGFLNQYRGALVTALEAQAKQLHVDGRDNETVTLRDSVLRIPPAKMEEFLQPAIRGITDCIDNLLATLSSERVEINTIYLVGGFGGCHYVYDLFRERYGANRQIIVPPNWEYAIVEGAVLFRANPGIVRSRKADATYGKSVVRHFESFHDERYRQGDYCHNLFQTIVGRGESIRPDSLYMAVSRPLCLEQTKMHFEVFSSQKPAEELWYTRDEGVVLIGELVLELPEVGRLVRDRQVEIFFDFSHTEIQVKAIDRTSKAEVKAVLDFLSAIPPDQQRKVKVQEQAPAEEAADRHREEQLDGEEREGEEREGEGREGGEREGERGGEEGGESDGAANQDLNA